MKFGKNAALNVAALCCVAISVANAAPSTVTDIDGNDYKTIKIGRQIWMAQNLAVVTYRNGDQIRGKWWSKEPSLRGYDSYELEKQFGRLYNGYAILDKRGLCPTGWRLPTVSDWQKLIEVSGGTDKAGVVLKSTDSWTKNTEKNDMAPATNKSGFSAMPAGQANETSVSDTKLFGNFWALDGQKTKRVLLRYQDHSVKITDGYEKQGYNVRCIRD